MEPPPRSVPAPDPWVLTLGTLQPAASPAQGERGVPGSRMPGLKAGSSRLCSEQGCCACYLCVSTSILGKGAGHTGMLPCPLRASDEGSCWRRSCSTRCVVMLPSGFCPHCRARGPRRWGPRLPTLPPPSRPWAQLCPTLAEQRSGTGCGFAWVELGLVAAPHIPPSAAGAHAMLVPSRRNTTTGNPSSGHRHQHRGAAGT